MASKKTSALLREFAADWRLAGNSPQTAKTYTQVLASLLADLEAEDTTLADVKAWIATVESTQGQRLRGRASRAFFKWADAEEVLETCGWWRRIPLTNVAETAQRTTTPDEAEHLISTAPDLRSKALLSVLWCSGLRISEVARMQIEHLDLENGNVLIPVSKTKKPRLAPLDRRSVKLLRRYTRGREGAVWLGLKGAMSASGLGQLLHDLDAPPAHAWRRGWACHSLGVVSQASVMVAGGWSPNSARILAQYTRARASEISMLEFREKWTA